MKKYFLGIVAVLFAVALSAFTSGSGNHAKKEKPLTDLYWYLFDGTQITTQVGTGPTDKTSAETATTCSDNPIAAVCAYGYMNEQTGLPKPPGAFNDRFKKSN